MRGDGVGQINLPPIVPSRPSSVFSALRHRDFRLFLGGQLVSQCGTWVQTVALGWLVLQLTDSAFAVGLVTALGSLPILLFTLYGGVVADRVDKRRLVLVLQCLMLLEALTLAVLTHGGWITVHLVMALAAFSVVTLAAIVYSFTATPIYEGRVQLLIESDDPNVIDFQQVTGDGANASTLSRHHR